MECNSIVKTSVALQFYDYHENLNNDVSTVARYGISVFAGIMLDCSVMAVFFPVLQELRECEGKVFVDAEPEFAVPEVGR